MCQLAMSARNVFRCSFDRPNLKIEIVYKDAIDEPLRDLCRFIKPLARRGSCIVYGTHCGLRL